LDWESIFQKRILNRGFDYYERELVLNLEVSTSLLEANVQGSKLYAVDIGYNSIDKEITSLHCDCPHFESGYFCKHLAAFLFYLENKFNDFNELAISVADVYGMHTEKEEDEKSVDALVAEADEATVRNFLTETLKENNHLKEQFKGLLRREITPAQMADYMSDIDDIFQTHGNGPDNFIDYYAAMEFEVDVSDFIHNIIEKILLKHGFYEETFDLISLIFVKIASQPMDDSGGAIVNIVYTCQNHWSTIIAESSLDLKRKMYAWFKEQLSHTGLYNFDEYLEEILFDHFTEEEFLIDKKELAKRKFEDHKDEETPWSQRMHAPNWSDRYVKTLDKLGQKSEIDDFCQNNLQYSRVREIYAEQLLERNQLEEAIRLLEEGKSEVSREYKIKLKDLYKDTGDYENYRKELWDLLIDKRSIDLDMYREFQDQYSKEKWESQKTDILKELSSAQNIDELYAEEELYELLLENVTKSYGLRKLQKHEKKLVTLYPDEVLDRYEKEILAMSELAGPRKKYRKIVDLLGRMRRLSHEKSKGKVSEIVTYLRDEYNNRPAMMDELSQLSLK